MKRLPGPAYPVYRSRPALLERLRERGGGHPSMPRPSRPPRERRRRPLTVGRVLRLLAAAIAAWLALSLALFLISAQIQQGKLSAEAERALDGAGFPLTSPTTILVLGSDLRSAGTREPGATTSGPSRSDTILLMRVGAGRSARLSIPRDTIVQIPGYGAGKINSAYAIGSAPLAIETVRGYLGIEIDHLVEVDFESFPKLIDALGGVDYRGGCVVSRINGGFRNGGYTLRLRAGESHLDGEQALALARTRQNDCNHRETDLARARRQQKILAAIKGRLTSPAVFARLPWISWHAPRTFRSDMAGPTLLGVFASMATSGEAPPRVLRPSGASTLSDGGSGLVVSDAERRAAVRRLLAG